MGLHLSQADVEAMLDSNLIISVTADNIFLIAILAKIKWYSAVQGLCRL
jgi:hypothetical protein